MFVKTTQEQLSAVSKLAAQLSTETQVVQIAFAYECSTKTEDIYYLLSNNIGDKIQLRSRNDKKNIVTFELDLKYGLRYTIPTLKSGEPNIKITNLILELAANSQLLNTELGLDWIVLALRILNLVELKRKSAVDVTLQTATILDWKIELKLMKEQGYDLITIITWLTEVSHLSNKLSDIEKTELLKLITVTEDEIEAISEEKIADVATTEIIPVIASTKKTKKASEVTQPVNVG